MGFASGKMGLLLDCSILTLKGLQVLPGVISADYYTGEIKVMVQTIQNTVPVTPDPDIDQLVILHWKKIGKCMKKERRSKGFESSDAY